MFDNYRLWTILILTAIASFVASIKNNSKPELSLQAIQINNICRKTCLDKNFPDSFVEFETCYCKNDIEVFNQYPVDDK